MGLQNIQIFALQVEPLHRDTSTAFVAQPAKIWPLRLRGPAE